MSIRQAVDHLRQDVLHSVADAVHFFLRKISAKHAFSAIRNVSAGQNAGGGSDSDKAAAHDRIAMRLVL